MLPLASSDQLLALVDEVGGQLVVSHELLEAHQVEAARAQAEEQGAGCEHFENKAKGTKCFQYIRRKCGPHLKYVAMQRMTISMG